MNWLGSVAAFIGFHFPYLPRVRRVLSLTDPTTQPPKRQQHQINTHSHTGYTLLITNPH